MKSTKVQTLGAIYACAVHATVIAHKIIRMRAYSVIVYTLADKNGRPLRGKQKTALFATKQFLEKHPH